MLGRLVFATALRRFPGGGLIHKSDCYDDDTGAVQVAAEYDGTQVNGCRELEAFCADYDMGLKVQAFCPLTCHRQTGCTAAFPPPPAEPLRIDAVSEKVLDEQVRIKSQPEGECEYQWRCPDEWSRGGVPAPFEEPDARAFVAVNNLYRCMHDVQPVEWDPDVYASAKLWADKIGEFKHRSDSADCPYSDGENLGGTFKASNHRGVDATHNWYSEMMNPCYFRSSCYQTGADGSGRLTAMIWSSVKYIAYADPTQEVAVARYRTCDDRPPNSLNEFKRQVPVPSRTYDECLTKVLECPTFKDLTPDDLEGCEGIIRSNARDGNGQMVWTMRYERSCQEKYSYILEQTTRLDNASAPALLRPRREVRGEGAAASILRALGGATVGFAVFGAAVLAVRLRLRRSARHGGRLRGNDEDWGVE